MPVPGSDRVRQDRALALPAARSKLDEIGGELSIGGQGQRLLGVAGAADLGKFPIKPGFDLLAL